MLSALPADTVLWFGNDDGNPAIFGQTFGGLVTGNGIFLAGPQCGQIAARHFRTFGPDFRNGICAL